MSRETCRWLWELSGIHMRERGFHSSVGVSSEPSAPDCHGYMAPAQPAAWALARASLRRR